MIDGSVAFRCPIFHCSLWLAAMAYRDTYRAIVIIILVTHVLFHLGHVKILPVKRALVNCLYYITI